METAASSPSAESPGDPGETPGFVAPDWRWLLREPHLGVVICTDAGHVIEANEHAAHMWSGVSRINVVGQTIAAFYGEQVESETIDNIAVIYRSGKIGYVRSLWRGRQLVSTLHRVGSDGSEHHMLILTRHVWGHIEEDEKSDERFCKVTTSYIDLGELDVLTSRELEVLALMGAGLSLTDISEKFHRSVKTIGAHRDSIGRKLNVNSRVDLVNMALKAGLCASDATLKRVKGTKRLGLGQSG